MITTASPANHAALRSIGADVTINYRDSDAIAQVIAAASGSLPYGLDCVSENGTTASTIEIMGASNGRHLVTLLPVSEEDSKSASEKGIKVEFTLAYTVMGDEVLFAHAVHFDAMPEDRAAINKWTHEEAPALFEGWTQGKGSPRWKGPALRKMPGGLEKM